MKQGKICYLILCMSLSLAGCGINDGGEMGNSASVDPVSRYVESRAGEAGAPEESYGSPDSSTAEDDENEMLNIMENPAYSAMDRQVVTAVVTTPFRETMDRIISFNESSPDYFIEMKNYGGGAEQFEVLETQLPLEVLSGKGPDLVIWDLMNYSPAMASDRLMENLYEFMAADPDFHMEDYYENIARNYSTIGIL